MTYLKIKFVTTSLALVFAVTTTATTYAASSTLTSELPQPRIETAAPKFMARRLTVFMTSYPVPILQSEGVGFGIEYALGPSTAVAAGFNKTVKDQSDGYFAREEKHTNQFYAVSLKYAPFTMHGISPYLAAGYQRGEMSSFIQPPIFLGKRADTHLQYEGAFPSIGFRAELLKSGNLTLVADASLSYLPGVTAHSELIQDEPPSSENFAGKNHLETKLAYGWQPFLLIGANF
jgi:hypothetical protein